ncbi:MAG: vWA domain-containing protein [Flavisolibacter sp.]
MLYDWLQHIVFANTWMLPFLLLVPVIAWLRYRMQRSLKAGMLVSSSRSFTTTTARTSMVNLPFWLRLLALACIILALARPQIRDSQSITNGQGIDIVLAVDVSGSMLAPDFRPNRMYVARQVAAEFVQKRPVDQIALVIFSGESYTMAPLTSNHDLILQQINSLRSGMLQDGTLIGEGLAAAVERLSQSTSKSKVIILLTDGKEEAPPTRIIDPLTALEIAKAKKVKVYTIGMASAPGSAEARALGLRDAQTAIDESLLQRIARETGGEYFRATDANRLEQIYSRIDRLEKSTFRRTVKEKVQEQFPYVLLAALFFLLLEQILKYTLLRTFP